MKALDTRKVKNEKIKNNLANGAMVTITDKKAIAQANVETAKHAVNKYRKQTTNQ